MEIDATEPELLEAIEEWPDDEIHNEEDTHEGDLVDQPEENAAWDYEEVDEDASEPQFGDQEANALIAAAEALTVTSRKLATIAQARGFYNTDNKGKGKKGIGKHKGKGKSKGKGKGLKGPSSKGSRRWQELGGASSQVEGLSVPGMRLSGSLDQRLPQRHDLPGPGCYR